MVFWIFLALMTGTAVMTVLWPLSRAVAVQRKERSDVVFYQDQLAEIERDQERGLISASEAASARVEAGRRLIRASETAQTVGSAMGEPALRRRRAASAVALSVVPLVGLALYGAVGSPHLPGQPLAARAAADPKTMDVASAVARIEAHLAQTPEDRRGWELIAPIYLRLSRFDDAARAYAAAIRLGATGPDQLTGYGEALVSAADGVVSADAKNAFDTALKAEPTSAKARFYLALAAEQDGDVAGARAGYGAIIGSAPENAPYLPVVRARLSRLDGQEPEAAARSTAGEPVPAAIVAMVEGLDQRLQQSGGDEAEWSRLVRSMAVLGRLGDARERLGRARIALKADPAALARLDELAGGLGLTDTRSLATGETQR
jgi:cytochrome c-type biogenesis protein CcmH